MIRTENVRMDGSVHKIRPHVVADNKVVDPPTDVALSRARHIIPPCIVSAILIKEPERVEITLPEPFIEESSFDRQKAGRARIFFRPGNTISV